jgi:DNA-binding transcriptional MerR regulator
VAIGELARSTGIATSALRYYERIGLLRSAERVGGRRYYPASSRDELALIRLCQDAGFTLAQIRELVAGMRRGRRSWHPLAERKIDELDARIAEAQQAKDLIEHALHCRYRNILRCPNFRAALQARREPARQGSIRRRPEP